MQDINVPAAFAGVSQRVSEITLFRCLKKKFNYLKTKAMEKRIKLTTTTSFNLSDEELQRFYTVMSLLQYHHHRTPEYRQESTIRRLRNEFSRYNVEIVKACQRDPNNLALSQIRNFIEHHYGYLKRVTKQIQECKS